MFPFAKCNWNPVTSFWTDLTSLFPTTPHEGHATNFPDQISGVTFCTSAFMYRLFKEIRFLILGMGSACVQDKNRLYRHWSRNE
jgi:hypothetical protein